MSTSNVLMSDGNEPVLNPYRQMPGLSSTDLVTADEPLNAADIGQSKCDLPAKAVLLQCADAGRERHDRRNRAEADE